jgi:hypothetical protein
MIAVPPPHGGCPRSTKETEDFVASGFISAVCIGVILR